MKWNTNPLLPLADDANGETEGGVLLGIEEFADTDVVGNERDDDTKYTTSLGDSRNQRLV